MKHDDIRRRIEARMEELGLNQRSLALKAGLHQDAVRNILRGRSKYPRINTMEKIHKILWEQPAPPPFESLQEPGARKPRTPGRPRQNRLTAFSPIETTEDHDDLSGIDADMLVNATLLVREVFGVKKITPGDIRDLALAACRIAAQTGTQLINRTLVQYLHEVHQAQKKAAAPSPEEKEG